MAIELALTQDFRWTSSPAEVFGAARDAGFSAVGVAADAVGADTAELYTAAGLRCHELLALIVTSDDAATLVHAERLANAAAAANAQWVCTVFGSQITSETVALTRRCAAILAEAGTRLAVEFSPIGPLTSIPAGLDLITQLGTARSGLLIDTWHFAFGDSTWDDLATVPLESIAYVQFADAPKLASDKLFKESINRRAMPGDGDLELDRFASTLLDRGWDGTVSVEVLNKELSTLPVPEFARMAYESTVRYWR